VAEKAGAKKVVQAWIVTELMVTEQIELGWPVTPSLVVEEALDGGYCLLVEVPMTLVEAEIPGDVGWKAMGFEDPLQEQMNQRSFDSAPVTSAGYQAPRALWLPHRTER
jgi:hypothetical protein